MFRRKKRRQNAGNGSQANPQQAAVACDQPKPLPGGARTGREAKAPPPLTEAFMSAIEKAGDRAHLELASKGKVGPMAFFVHADGTMKVVSLTLKGGQQKEALVRRISEKVTAEDAFAVIVLTETDDEHEMILSGVTPGARASARVDFGFDKKTKTVTSWKMSWLNQPVQTVFLDGIFDTTGQDK
jgi:hypothetical protein